VSTRLNRFGVPGALLALVLPVCTAEPVRAQALPASAPSRPAASPGNDQFIVRLKPDTRERGQAAARQALLDEVGRAHGIRLSWLRRMSLGGDVIRADRPMDAHASAALLERLRKDPRVEVAHVDQRWHPANSYHILQWNYGDFDGINAREAWPRSTGQGIRVAVLDTGITAHHDLDSQRDPGYDFVSHAGNAADGDGRDADPADPGDWHPDGFCFTGVPGRASSTWHGTSVAGIIAAAANGLDGVGVAYNARLVPIRVLGKCGGFTSDIADAILWAAGVPVAGVPDKTDPVEVINLSVGSPGWCDVTTQQAINAAVLRGTTVVVAAGNSAEDVAGTQPANCENVIAVGASRANGGRASYSNFGEKIDVVAPGSDVRDGPANRALYSTTNGGQTTPGTPGFGTVMGTSFAAPHVAGTVALMQAAKVRSPAEVERLLKATAVPKLFNSACLRDCGDGLVHAGLAVNSDIDPYLYIKPSEVRETNGDQVVTFTAALTEAVAFPVSFDVAAIEENPEPYTGSHYGSDFLAMSAHLTIPAGQLAADFQVTFVGDGEPEGRESLFLAISNATGVTVHDPSVEIYILDDDIRPIIVHPAAGYESGPMTFTFDLPNATADWFGYQISLHPGKDGWDDVGGGWHMMRSVPPFTTTDTFTIAVVDDLIPEGSETFELHVYHDVDQSVRVTTGTILDQNPEQTLAVSDVSVIEGNGGTPNVMRFTAMLARPALAPVSFTLSTVNGSAQAGVDYVAKSARLTIPEGMTTATFDVALLGDTTPELVETFYVMPTAIVGAEARVSPSGVGSILSDDTPLVSVSDAQVVEGNAGTKQLVFTLSLSHAAPADLHFNIGTANGTATAGSDYVARNGIADIWEGDSSTTFAVDITGDTSVEANETLRVNLSNPVGAILLDAQGIGTITNDDGPTLSIADASITEGDGGFPLVNFIATLSYIAQGDVTFSVSTADGTAIAGADYTATTLTGLMLPAGSSSKSFSIPLHGDTAIEHDETFQVLLGSVTGATISDGTAVGTIVNDDFPQLRIADASVVEGDEGTLFAKFNVTLSPAAPFDVAFDVGTVAAGTATVDVDYQARTRTGQTIAAGSTSREFTVAINGDDAMEPDETFVVKLSNVTGARVADGSALGTIVSDDKPTLVLADAWVSEGHSGTKALTFTASLSEPAPYAITFDAATTGAGTAAAGVDYFAANLTGLVIPAGVTSKTISVTVLGDIAIENDETLVLALANVKGATVGDGTALGRILNDDFPRMSIADVSVTEGNSGLKVATFTVQLSAPAPYAITYDAGTTAAGTATAGSDYVGTGLMAQTLAAGATSKSFPVTLSGDTTIENNETFVVALSNVAGALLADGSALGTIVNDDKPTLTIADLATTEGHADTKLATFTVSLSAPAPYPITFSAATTGAGTAAAGTDYLALATTGFTIPAGQTAKTLAVTLKGDTTVEPNETYVVSVSGVSGANVGDGSALGTITNDD
jgi:subtilisin family serine protease